MRSNSQAAMNFGLDPMIEEVRETVARWVDEKLLPRAAEIDATNKFPRDLWPELGSLGLLGITSEEDYGGAGLGYLAHCVVR
ncbi:MAG: acyl-CoA dehydrogenase family protein [Parvularculaceae bacterium]|nr:acyl-CoA dehydrogenase family protein [Parvularculaceae bacterium]